MPPPGWVAGPDGQLKKIVDIDEVRLLDQEEQETLGDDEPSLCQSLCGSSLDYTQKKAALK